MTLLAPNETRTLIDELLEEQQQLTAVERFALRHARKGFDAGEQFYRDLLPARAPHPGEQYAFAVDLDACSGCKACVTACHNRNGLDENESWREVGLLHASTEPFLQTVTTACHHCVDPACLSGCPVLAYDKDPVTGIVRHLDDQCIGCQYCVMKCPYEVPKYSPRLGIVRKCDMCSSRLEAGEAPACAQACPSSAISISLVGRADTQARFREAGSANGLNTFLPDSPDPRITLPTTRFLSRHPLPEKALAADHGVSRLDQPHWPLVLMLVLTQAAAGIFLASALERFYALGSAVQNMNVLGCVFLCAGLAISALHLGQPLKAWRAFLGWRTSWLSREIIVMSAFAFVAMLAAVSPSFPSLARWQNLLACATASAGFAAVFISGMVYVDTRRPFWSPHSVFGNFFGTTLLLGAIFSALVSGGQGQMTTVGKSFAVAAVVIRAALLTTHGLELRAALHDSTSPIHFNACVIRDLLHAAATAQTLLFIASTVFSLLAISGVGGLWWLAVAVLTAFGSELSGRYVFFAAGGSKRMPGGIGSLRTSIGADL